MRLLPFLLLPLLLLDIYAKDAGFYGDVRALYMNKSKLKENNFDAKAFALGTNLGYRYFLNDALSFEGEVGFALPLYGFAKGDEALFGMASPNGFSDIFGQNRRDSVSYMQLSNLNVGYEVDGTKFIAGAQELDTPLTKAHDVRLVPNRFAALYFEHQLTPTLELFALESFAMVGALDNNDHLKSTSSGHYSSMSKAVHPDIPDEADLAAIGARYDNEKITSNAWFYALTQVIYSSDTPADETVMVLFTDIDYKISSKSLLSAQYMNASLPASVSINNYNDFAIYGLKFEQQFGDFRLILAYNRSVGSGIILDVWGARPEYTVADEFWFSSLDLSEAKSSKIGVNFRANREFCIKTAVIEIEGDDTIESKKGATIVDISFNYKPMENIELFLLNETINYYKKPTQELDQELLKYGVTFTF
jgi:hypothetical protein